MTIAELRPSDLKHIKGPYWYYSYGDVYNIFAKTGTVDPRKLILEPVTLKTMLIELSDKVDVGNNFSEIAARLPITSKMSRDAIDLDRIMALGFFV